MPVRTANAAWGGNLKSGNGTMKLGSGAYEGAYSFASRFEDGKGTNPEELIAAAHAGCFSMALAHALDGAGHTATHVQTSARVHLEPTEGGFHIPKIELDCVAEVPGLDAESFQKFAEATKSGCPVSKVLAGATIALNAQLA